MKMIMFLSIMLVKMSELKIHKLAISPKSAVPKSKSFQNFHNFLSFAKD